MTCGNPIKHKFQNAFNSFIDAISFERKLSPSASVNKAGSRHSGWVCGAWQWGFPTLLILPHLFCA